MSIEVADTVIENPHASRHHEMGAEMLAIHNIEALRQMCPMMGRLSVEQVEQFLEMQAHRQNAAAPPTQNEISLPQDETHVAITTIERVTESSEVYDEHVIHDLEERRLQDVHTAIIKDVEVQTPAREKIPAETILYDAPALSGSTQETETAELQDTYLAESQPPAVFDEHLETQEAPVIAAIESAVVVETTVNEVDEFSETAIAVYEPEDGARNITVQEALPDLEVTYEITLDDTSEVDLQSQEEIPYEADDAHEIRLQTTADVYEAVHTIHEVLIEQDEKAEYVEALLEQIQEMVNEKSDEPEALLLGTEQIKELIYELLLKADVEPTEETIAALVQIALRGELIESKVEPDKTTINIQLLSQRIGTNEYITVLSQPTDTSHLMSTKFFWLGRSVLNIFALQRT